MPHSPTCGIGSNRHGEKSHERWRTVEQPALEEAPQREEYCQSGKRHLLRLMACATRRSPYVATQTASTDDPNPSRLDERRHPAAVEQLLLPVLTRDRDLLRGDSDTEPVGPAVVGVVERS
ncbi:MAG: hypothetical protein WKF58_04375 [Ilumatobacteraceae bacterium]